MNQNDIDYPFYGNDNFKTELSPGKNKMVAIFMVVNENDVEKAKKSNVKCNSMCLEMFEHYSADDIKEICGNAGDYMKNTYDKINNKSIN